MRGRKPRALTVPATERVVLAWIADNSALPDYQRERARMVLALSSGARVQDVARDFACVGSTVWRVCRRYEFGGLSGLLADGRRRAGDQPANTDRDFHPEPVSCAV